ncbi:MAG: (Fe-S)-binding protein [Planctomycetes bacterium]|nr:(Fe-S)-binding protein [Planctomycetota bacterium]
MGPVLMALLLLAGWGIFAYSAWRRWKLMMVGAPANRGDRRVERLARTVTYAFGQVRMPRYPLAGMAHVVIFFGFLALLLRSLILWGRGFDESFNLWIFGPDQVLGQIYSVVKDVAAILVFIAALVFIYYRMIARLPRMTLSTEGLIIIWIIAVMMMADVLYDGAIIAQHARVLGVPVAPLHLPRGGAEESPVLETKYTNFNTEPGSPLARHGVSFSKIEPAGSVAAMAVQGLPDGVLTFLKHLGFWTHSALVLIFLNLLPYSKHFHVITAIPNVYTQDLHPPGRLHPIDDIEGKLEREETLGIKRINQFSWKSILDFYTCTECGRCTDHCPANSTGKKLSPKQLTLDLRDFLYAHDKELVAAKAAGNLSVAGEEGEVLECHKDLVDGVIDPEVLWACTSCRACEQECPVFVTYIDKIMDLRRYLVQERGEFPNELQSAFRCLESSYNPWGFPADERAKWAEGLGVKTMTEHPDAEYLFWVGCAPAFDDRAKRVTRATVQLMQRAGVDFAILGDEEQCTGDLARRAGNEYLFQMFAQANIEVLNNYGVDKKKIITTCPHCFNTLAHEYGDFGGHYNVIHHTTLLADLVRSGKLRPTNRVDQRVVFHDSCYLGRYNDVYDDPRDVLRSIPGLTLVESAETLDRGMCCGAGGAQMFKEEEAGDIRINAARTKQLLATNPDTISSACPFCMRMLTDGLADLDRETLPQLDVSEILLQAVGETIPAEVTAPSA